MTAAEQVEPDTATAAKASRPVVLVLIGVFWPGHEATGPNQSIAAMATALGSEFEFRIIARDRPIGAAAPLAASQAWFWQSFADFRYCRPRPWGASGLREAIATTPHDVMVLNGFFDREFTIPALLMRRAGLVPRRPTIMSPRGEFSAGAAALAKPHKQLYLAANRRLGLLDDVIMHATVDREAEDIRRHCQWVNQILVAPNIRCLDAAFTQRDFAATSGQPLRLVFLSRIDRKKNLVYALDVLGALRVPVVFDIFGPVSDEAYWRECQTSIAKLPGNIQVNYRGAIPNAQVAATLAGYDAFLLPTEGENFGHAIFDALAAGLPVILSDQTPWTDLERQQAGWSLPLDRPEAFAGAILELDRMNANQRLDLVQGARRLAEAAVLQGDAVARNRQMLLAAISRSPRQRPEKASARPHAQQAVQDRKE